MTSQQIKNKIEELDFWLTHNPTHPDHARILADKRDLENKLLPLTPHE